MTFIFNIAHANISFIPMDIIQNIFHLPYFNLPSLLIFEKIIQELNLIFIIVILL